MRRVPRAELLRDAQPKACHPAVPLPAPSHHFPHGAKLPFDCAYFSCIFLFPSLSEYTLCAVTHGSSLSCPLGSSAG